MKKEMDGKEGGSIKKFKVGNDEERRVNQKSKAIKKRKIQPRKGVTAMKEINK